jgi:TetR/AcrR family transcriptional repressor of nem operon
MSARGKKTKAKIIRTAADLAYRQGFQTTGLQEILERCAVPKGSFYFHFANKEALGQEVVRLRQKHMLELVHGVFSGTAPLRAELARWFDTLIALQKNEGEYCGCPVGNLAQELSTVSDTLREEIAACFAATAEVLAARLRQAQEQGILTASVEPRQFARFLLHVTQGALLLVKVERSTRPLRDSKEMLLTLLSTVVLPNETVAKGGTLHA